MYEAAITSYVGWQRQRLLLGEERTSPALRRKLAQLEKLLDAAWKQVVKRADERCQKGGFDVIGRILPLERQRQLLGLGGRPNEFSKVTKRCWRFELRVTSKLTRSADGGSAGLRASEHMTWELQAKVPLQLKSGGNGEYDIALGQLVGSAPLSYTVREYRGDGEVSFGALGSGTCTYSFGGQTQAGTVQVIDGSIMTRWNGPLEPYFTFDVGQPQELIAQVCSGSGLGQDWTDNEPQWKQHWLEWWRSAHATDSASAEPGGDEDGGPWTIRMRPGRHPIVGRLEFSKQWSDRGASLSETWELVHKPLRTPKQPTKRR